ncbi:uncharacterized protein [Dysidea avara]|uniref:uncharacterized protein n=1 Tax=Dysidea avara TaxID=196820 RepID=UPI00332CE737
MKLYDTSYKNEVTMVRKLKFDVRKRSSQGKTKLTASDVKALTQPTSTMVNAETQTDSRWFVDSKEVQTESEEDCTNATVTIGTQTEPDVVLQAPQDNLTNQGVRAVNDESMKCCEGIVDEKYTSLIAKHNGLFKDATGKVIGYVERNGGIRHVDCLKHVIDCILGPDKTGDSAIGMDKE